MAGSALAQSPERAGHAPPCTRRRPACRACRRRRTACQPCCAQAARADLLSAACAAERLRRTARHASAALLAARWTESPGRERSGEGAGVCATVPDALLCSPSSPRRAACISARGSLMGGRARSLLGDGQPPDRCAHVGMTLRGLPTAHLLRRRRGPPRLAAHCMLLLGRARAFGEPAPGGATAQHA